MNVFVETVGRSYNYFFDFKRDRLEELDASKLYHWINKHKKIWLRVSELDKQQSKQNIFRCTLEIEFLLFLFFLTTTLTLFFYNSQKAFVARS